jgi:hypothetical protein
VFREVSILAARDIDLSTIIAVIVFAIISIVGNWAKKRGEAKQAEADEKKPAAPRPQPRASRPPRAPPAVRRKAEPIEREPRVPALPEIAKAVRRLAERAAGTSVLDSAPLPTVSVRAEVPKPLALPRKAPPAVKPSADGARPRRRGLGRLERASLRRAVILAEVLGPPAALRDPPERDASNW